MITQLASPQVKFGKIGVRNAMTEPLDIDREALAKWIATLCYRQGRFELRSGQEPSYYWDKYRTIESPSARHRPVCGLGAWRCTNRNGTRAGKFPVNFVCQEGAQEIRNVQCLADILSKGDFAERRRAIWILANIDSPAQKAMRDHLASESDGRLKGLIQNLMRVPQ